MMWSRRPKTYGGRRPKPFGNIAPPIRRSLLVPAGFVRIRTTTSVHLVNSRQVADGPRLMADDDPELERLMKAERLAFERYDRLRGYPGNVQEVALALWTKATTAVRDYRAKHP